MRGMTICDSCYFKEKCGIVDFVRDKLKYCRMYKARVTNVSKDGWIPTAERNPEVYRDEEGNLIPFLATYKSGNVLKAYYDGTNWSNWFTAQEIPIAWMVCPEPYKE